jgi:hypothetical protein
MKVHYLTLLCALFLLACRPGGQPIPITRLPAATAVSSTATTFPPTLSPTDTPTGSPIDTPTASPTSTSTNTATPQPTATPEPTIEVITSETAFTYVSEEGNFSVDLPPKTEVYEEYFPSVDGVFVEVPNGVSIIRREPSLALEVQWVPVDEAATLDDFIAAQTQCVSITPNAGETITLSGQNARLYDNVPCSASYSSFLYVIKEDRGYILSFQAMTPLRFLQDFIDEMLAGFALLDATE